MFTFGGEIKKSLSHFYTRPFQDVLKETYGVILFQEQVLRIAHFFAGLSYAEADAFRRAMTKDRKSRKMELLKQSFIEGAIDQGHSKFSQRKFSHRFPPLLLTVFVRLMPLHSRTLPIKALI